MRAWSCVVRLCRSTEYRARASRLSMAGLFGVPRASTDVRDEKESLLLHETTSSVRGGLVVAPLFSLSRERTASGGGGEPKGRAGGGVGLVTFTAPSGSRPPAQSRGPLATSPAALCFAAEGTKERSAR